MDRAPAFSLEASLARAAARVPEALAAIGARRRVDLSGAPDPVAALVLSRAAQGSGRPFLVVTPDLESARRTAENLSFFAGSVLDEDQPADVLLFPASDVTPYLEVAPDRRAAMDRLATLFHLAHGLPFRFVVAPAGALARRVAPREALRSRSRVIRAEEALDRDELTRVLVEGGYLRVPVAEDPGTFAIRGALIDIYPPHARNPARIELDDWLVLSIRHFDPDNQRTISEIGELFVHPVRDTLLGAEELRRAKERVRSLCDAVDLPTSRTRQLLEDIEAGRSFYGIDGFLPAFHERLETLFDYLPPECPTAILDPTACVRGVGDELARAEEDRAGRVAQGAPAYPLGAHYLDAAGLAAALQDRPVALFHRPAIGGAPDPELEGSPLAALESVPHGTALALGGEDQRTVAAELKARRQNRQDALEPLARRAGAWLEAGLRVLFAARTRAQADRLARLLRSHGLPVQEELGRFDPRSLERAPTGQATVVVGALGGGFVLASEALAVVTEEDVFGSRAHRRAERRTGRGNREPFVEDLRELRAGDFVVHVDHGVGRYLGLERKRLGLSQLERLQGREAASVEVLVVEYGAGDRLFLPVSRLNQIQKLSGKEGKEPKLDRLGGQTFTRTKAKVRERVRQLADELLVLYAERAAATRPSLPEAGPELEELEATFPFEETADQAKAIDDVLGDLGVGRPMDRVVCGDVGFGKTEVAIRAAFRVAMSGKQVAVLCPTTVLAQQHYLGFRERFRDHPLEVRVLSRFVDRATQAVTLAALKEGKVDVVVGTHRLLSKDVHFRELGLLVVDEEQRFGVAHKERIKKLRTQVDVLTLSATPIPRTLQMAIGGLRDLSLITTPPVDRRAVRTFVSRWDDHVVREAIRREMARGGQTFFVYNRIEGLYERAQRLQALLPEAKIAVAHGQMKEGQLERVMTDFVEGRYDVLCSTAIVESGLDIPRANTMLIDRADIFGLAQLYQLRGRVGRSRERAYCYLLTPPPSVMTDEARYRIEALERFTELGSGFHVASLDMEQRGAGDILGAEQSGNVALVGFDLFLRMLEEAVAELRGEVIVHEVDPELTVDLEHHLPDDYVEDVGLRLSLYKRFASAEDEQAVTDIAAEMEDRFGEPPAPAKAFTRVMAYKPALRALRVLGCEATSDRVTLHLREDTPLDPAKVLARVAAPRSPYRLTPDLKLTRRFDDRDPAGLDAIDRLERLLAELEPLRREAGSGTPETR